MSKMQGLRDKLAADLAVLGVPVMDQWAIRAEPPTIFLAPPLAGPYVTPANTFQTYVMGLDVVVLVLRRPPDEGRAELEDLIEGVLVNSVDWAMRSVDSPAVATITDSTFEYLGSVVHLAKDLTL